MSQATSAGALFRSGLPNFTGATVSLPEPCPRGRRGGAPPCEVGSYNEGI